MPRFPLILLSDLVPGERYAGIFNVCPCGAGFLAAADARYCSDACRKRASRSPKRPAVVGLKAAGNASRS